MPAAAPVQWNRKFHTNPLQTLAPSLPLFCSKGDPHGHAAPAAADSLRPLSRWCRPRLHGACHRPRRRLPGSSTLAAGTRCCAQSSGFLLCWRWKTAHARGSTAPVSSSVPKPSD
ncbi:hypothetical protein GQ55_7G319400 [Panicum hallii var. hallii]|uniref:Uncharacterized protein n=1 Tax=Panicum hallii var. hallii TaxID=1504633 RepID=A0A2T7D189_9POAL|nr:hypothetical protein GQ55_7G319400 [Panicum hallii var. hallii]